MQQAMTSYAAHRSLLPFARTPVFWLAVALFVASIAGCVVTIMLALGQPDGALPDVGERLLSVPAAHAEDAR